ncbi:unnamed protein product [Blepharisma stoltei]|uniref:Uncharacterized protein n=1 Tax=Blepharisma stoltei TaxID=1481888 RepID=A0AAU9JLK0_9CILI|nr:unnamed protein product [Blepharisma stoltei]
MEERDIHEYKTSPFDKSLMEGVNEIKGCAKDLVERLEIPYRVLLKSAFECSRDCFSVENYELRESFACKNKCISVLESLKKDQEASFAQFDTALNLCFHSCTKQKRRTPYLSNEAVLCYRDCMERGKQSLIKMEAHFASLYSQYTDTPW